MTAISEHIDPGFPLSPEQQAVLAAHGDAPPHVSMRIDVEGPLDEARLRAAVRSVLARHEVLRHAVRTVNGYRGLRQIPGNADAAVDWHGIDASSLSADITLELDAIARQPFDLANGVSTRAALAVHDPGHATLMLAFSSLVADAGSCEALFHQIVQAYADGAHAGDDVFQYASFVEWRKELARSEDAERGRGHWTDHLKAAKALAAPRLHASGSGDAQASRVQVTCRLDEGTARRLRTWADRHGAGTPLATQALWWLLLARLSGQPQAIAGWQHDCREDYELMQGGVGVFAKVLPIVLDVPLHGSFSAWLDSLRDQAAAHVDAQEYWAIEAPALSAHLEVGFACARRTAARRAGGLLWRRTDRPTLAVDFGLAMQVCLGEDGGIELAIHADGRRHTPLSARCLLDQFIALTTSVLHDPDTPMSRLSLTNDAQRQALAHWEGESVEMGVADLGWHIAQWARRTPDAPAIALGHPGGAMLTWLGLETRVRRMAAWLREQGLQSGQLLALNLPRGIDLIVSMLAAWRLRAGWLCLDPRWPQARRDTLLHDAGVALLLQAGQGDATRTRHAGRWHTLDVRLAQADAAPNAGGLDDGDFAPAASGTLADTAYVLYTSGSTGQPKGVVIEQGALLNYVAGASAAMGLGSARRWAWSGNVAADLGHTALFGALYNGACLVVASDGAVKDAHAFARFMRDARIEGLKIVPSHLEALLECPEPCLPARLVLGGEAASAALIRRLRALSPDMVVFNHYGPTETTVGVLVHEVPMQGGMQGNEQDGLQGAYGVLPLSRVLPNNRIRVLDAQGELTPVGAMGEVHIGGAQLCRGYLGRDADAAGVFVPDPCMPGERLYRTGDLAVVLPQGGIRLMGRSDHQVKIQGYRVEPADIEAALLLEPGVRQAVVLALPSVTTQAGQAGQAGQVELAAALVMDHEGARGDTTAALRHALGQRLPAYMLPARYALLDALPRLPNGKVDRRALASALEAVMQAVPSDLPVQAPRDALEAAVSTGMAALLNQQAICTDQDFFEMGGHSLLVIKLVARLRKQLEMEIAPAIVFDHPTPRTLAAALRSLCAPEVLARLSSLADTTPARAPV